jgi:hypothetical protein
MKGYFAQIIYHIANILTRIQGHILDEHSKTIYGGFNVPLIMILLIHELIVLYKEQGNHEKAGSPLTKATEGRRIKLGDTHLTMLVNNTDSHTYSYDDINCRFVSSRHTIGNF